MGQRGRSSEIRDRGKKAGTRKISQVDKDIWKEAVRKNANEETMRSCNRCQGGICTKKRKGIPIVERRERRSERVHKEAVAKRIY